MAKPANYEAKINILNEKIEKKSAAIKQLKAELQEIKAKQEAERMKELVAFMEESDMSASRARTDSEGSGKGEGRTACSGKPAGKSGELSFFQNEKTPFILLDGRSFCLLRIAISWKVFA